MSDDFEPPEPSVQEVAKAPSYWAEVELRATLALQYLAARPGVTIEDAVNLVSLLCKATVDRLDQDIDAHHDETCEDCRHKRGEPS